MPDWLTGPAGLVVMGIQYLILSYLYGRKGDIAMVGCMICYGCANFFLAAKG